MVETITASCRGFVDLLEGLTRSRALKPLIDFYPGFKVTADEETRGLVARLGELGVQFKDAENLTFSTLTSLELEVGRTVTFPMRHESPGTEGANLA